MNAEWINSVLGALMNNRWFARMEKPGQTRAAELKHHQTGLLRQDRKNPRN